MAEHTGFMGHLEPLIILLEIQTGNGNQSHLRILVSGTELSATNGEVDRVDGTYIISTPYLLTTYTIPTIQ